jgi:hypothetical protein
MTRPGKSLLQLETKRLAQDETHINRKSGDCGGLPGWEQIWRAKVFARVIFGN